MEEDKIIISLGGSLIVPDGIDTDFLKSFKEVVLSEVKKGKKFIIITGGGKTARTYIESLLTISGVTDWEKDMLGIHATRLNAELLKGVFGSDYVRGEIIIDYTLPIVFEKPILVGGGSEPGHSSDAVAVMVAKSTGAKTVINLSNIDRVYDSDPRKNPEAKSFEQISWTEYLDIIPKDWSPGLSSPFDPVASRMAQGEGIEVVIMNGRTAENLASYLNGDEYIGTIIK